MKDIFSEQDLERIKDAINRAESRTSGEIVPVVVPMSDPYEVAMWKGGALAAVLALAAAVLVFQFYEGWGFGWLHTGWGVALITLIAGVAGAAAGAYIRPLKRLLAGPDDMTRAVHRRAMKAFVDEEVFATRDRTGILIFISLLEHRIEVLGDTGINQKVSSEEWVEIVERIQTGIRSGKISEGLVEAIEMCGTLLEKSGVEIREDDTDELSNALRMKKGH